MNLSARRAILGVHLAIVGAFLYTHQTHFELVGALVLHFLLLNRDSSCWKGHCDCQEGVGVRCQEEGCGVVKWCRMRHCYHCRRCIHKYDHHCVLLDVCIGQFNHKYYLLILGALFYNTLVLLFCFSEEMKGEVVLGEGGQEEFSTRYYLYAFSLLAIYFNAILTLYLFGHHLYFAANNLTTWEYFKRPTISYLKKVDPDVLSPFNRGLLPNFKQMFSSDPREPVDWAQFLPE